MAPLESLFMPFNGPYPQHQQGGDNKNHIADGVPYNIGEECKKLYIFKNDSIHINNGLSSSLYNYMI